MLNLGVGVDCPGRGVGEANDGGKLHPATGRW